MAVKLGSIGMALVVLGLAAGPAAASRTWTIVGESGGVIDVTAQLVGTFATLGGPMDAWQVSIWAHVVGDTVSALDVEFTPGDGQLFQISKPPTLASTPDLYNAQHLSNPSADSHFSLNADGNDWGPIVHDPAEDNDLALGLNPLGETEGYGTTLSVTAALARDVVSQNLVVANVVMPAGKGVFLDGTVGDDYNEVFTLNHLLIPEPGSAALVVVGVMALLRRRARR